MTTIQEQKLNITEIRKDFTILNQLVNGKPLVYLDSSATSLTPKQVIDKMNEYYNKYNANIHRGVHKLSELATQEYELAHKKVADFINADEQEVIFTKGTTESLNLLAYSLTNALKAGDEIILTQMEHHSNLVPWQQLANEKGLIVNYIKVNQEGTLDMDSFKNLLNEKTRIVAVTHMSNVLGTVNDIKTLAEYAHNVNAIFVVDGAQSAPHMKVDVKDLDCDFFAFSAHKMFGPTGIGVLYGKEHLLEQMKPFNYGGDMISEVTFSETTWNDIPWKFEAGTPNIAGGIGLGASVDYINKLGIQNIKEYIEELTQYTLEKLSKIEGIKIYGLTDKSRGPAISFSLKGIHPHDVAEILNKEGIAIRGGHLCAMPLVNSVLGAGSVSRVSLHVYNTKEEIDQLIEGLKKVKEIFK